eukprot:GHVT01007846.1.p1 GENE.GHVT01007846.1~~GHVT01007846.1.p1  ORF type:complete len:240 (-),score=25.06 GHVT01007846.1:100-819(-)
MGCPASPSSPPDSSFAFSTPVSSFPSTPGDLPLASAPPLLQRVQVLYTPTIPHCSQATLIGLMIRVKLYRCIASKYKVVVNIAKGNRQPLQLFSLNSHYFYYDDANPEWLFLIFPSFLHSFLSFHLHPTFIPPSFHFQPTFIHCLPSSPLLSPSLLSPPLPSPPLRFHFRLCTRRFAQHGGRGQQAAERQGARRSGARKSLAARGHQPRHRPLRLRRKLCPRSSHLVTQPIQLEKEKNM